MNKHSKLWYDKPAEQWTEALPIGNGRMGGMVFGRVNRERIQLNQDAVWSGGPQDRNNRSTIKHIDTIREMIFEGKIKEAEELAIAALTGTPESQRHYEPLGDLNIYFDEQGDTQSYKRQLSLDDGLCRTTYERDGIQFEQEIFASYPDQVMAVNLKFSEPCRKIRIQLSRGKADLKDTHIMSDFLVHDVSYQGYSGKFLGVSNDCIGMSGNTGDKNGIDFCFVVKASIDAGEIEVIGDYMIISNAKEITLKLASSSSFYDTDPEKSCLDIIEKVTDLSYEALKERHVEDHKALYQRMSLTIEENEDYGHMPTDQRIERVKEGHIDDGLVGLLFQYGRYLTIAGSRPGSLPTTLQGIWNDMMLPMWDSKYTININTQMNYWPTEKCNLSECHQPLFDHIERLVVNGRKTAEIMYGHRGSMCHHNFDIWADTAPQDTAIQATFWPVGLVWMCRHLWEHYEYTKDKAFLAKYYYVFEEASLFFLDYLVEDKDGKLVCGPSVSPEHSFLMEDGSYGTLCMGPSMDQEMIDDLFDWCIKSVEILDLERGFAQEVKRAKDNLLKVKIGKLGQIQEWPEDHVEWEQGHRHFSHLYALYPGEQFGRNNPEYHKAAEVSLDRRLEGGSGKGGWSLAWVINMLARFGRGSDAYDAIYKFLNVTLMPNLFNGRTGYQIDGNYGFTSGVAEMMMQSHEEAIWLLPALPPQWKSGEIKGLKARGGVTVDIQWSDGKLKEAVITADQDGSVAIEYMGEIKRFDMVEGIAVRLRLFK